MPAGAQRPLSWSPSPLGHCGDTDAGGRSPPACAQAGASCRHSQPELGSETGLGRRSQFAVSTRRQGWHRAQGWHLAQGWHRAQASHGSCLPRDADRSDAGAAIVPQAARITRDPSLGGGQSVPSSPHPQALVCPSVSAGCGGSGAMPRACSAPSGDGTGADRPGCGPALPGTGPFPSTSQPGTWWSRLFCCRKAGFWLPTTQMSPCPLVLPTLPWHQPALWHWGKQQEDAHRARLPQPRIAPRLGPALPCPSTLCPVLGVQQHRDRPVSPQPKNPTLAATAPRPPSTTR